jgi:hypothetical protein
VTLGRWACCAVLIAVAGCRSSSPAAPAPSRTPTPAPSASLAAEGESLEAAVLVPADNEEDGIAYENDWIWRHHGRFRRRSGGLASQAGRRYDVITVELSDHTQRKLFFDITDFYGREKPKK